MKRKYSLIFLVILFGCTNNNKLGNRIIINRFFENMELTGLRKETSVKMLYPMSITISENKLIVFDNVDNDIFKVFNLPDLEYSFSAGRKGKGPNEYIYIDELYFKGSKNGFEVLDNGTIKRALLSQNNISTFETIEFERMENPINHIEKLSDSIYIFDNIFTDDKFEFIKINVKTGEKKKFGSYPNFIENLENPIEKSQVYCKTKTSNLKNKRFVSFYSYMNLIKLYDEKQEVIKEITLNDVSFDRSIINSKLDCPLYFNLPYSTENYFYVLRYNSKEEEVVENIDCFKPDILIWDWDGNPIAKCTIDKLITSFAVSEKFKKIYGVSMFEKNKIFVFDIPNNIFK